MIHNLAIMNNNIEPENRNRKIDFDLNKIDYDWIEKTDNVRELKKAHNALE